MIVAAFQKSKLSTKTANPKLLVLSREVSLLSFLLFLLELITKTFALTEYEFMNGLVSLAYFFS